MFKRRQHCTGLRYGALLTPLLLGFAAGPAQAQFGWFGPSEASPQDVSDTIVEHGFTLVGPLYRNGRVYLADVIDKRQRRERLVILAESGQIVQRYFVDVGPERRGAPAYVSRPAPRDDSFFSHLTRGWDNEPPPRPPVGLSGPDDMPPAIAPAPPRAKPQPKVLTRTETPPVTASPLPPPSAATTASKPEVVTVPSSNATAPTGASAPSAVRGTSVSTDPLRIPGTRKAEESRDGKAAVPATVAATKAAEPPPPAPAKPAPEKPKPAPAADVPVAPLD